ncbi:GtrA family protein [bacterium]|nr:GtrA family protein [bacterium]
MQIPQTARFLIAGSTGAVVNLSTFYVLEQIWDVWYITASVFAFLLAFVVGFLLQRFWTFEYTGSDDFHRHALMYFVTALVNVGINAGIVAILVERWSLWPLFAQALAGTIVAVWSFFIYRYVIFVEKI